MASLAHDHNFWIVGGAALVCILGSCLTMLLSRRLVGSGGLRKQFQTSLSALIGGMTIWSTHFIAMLAYQPGVAHGFAPTLTVVSLGIAVGGNAIAKMMLAYGTGHIRTLGGGAVFGCTIAVMHYVGMTAYELPGYIIWSFSHVLLSVVLGAVLGALAYRSVIEGKSNHASLFATVLMVASICAMHFTGMAAISLNLNPLVFVSPQLMSDGVLATVVACVTTIILFIGFVGFSVELTTEREAVAAVQRSNLHDALTGLPNRLFLNQILEDLDDQRRGSGNPHVAVFTLDLDRFQEVNDIHGNRIGDAVLVEVASRLKEVCAPTHFVARTGGDEFAAVFLGFESNEKASSFAQRMQDAISRNIILADAALSVGVTIGVATTLSDETALDEVLQKADMAKYRAKSDVAQSICFFDADLDRAALDRQHLTHDLRQALPKQEFELNYQVQIGTSSGDIAGFEALLRWNHPIRGRVSPEVFIPLAEETGLIRSIGHWVLHEACLEAANWEKPYSIAVNVAPQQLVQPEFVAELDGCLTQSGLSPHRLEIEVTEATLIDDKARALEVMYQIKKMGVRIAMDDFGKGYSSLATLRAFPFDKIKVDRSFVSNLHLDHQRAAIVRSTLLLGDALKMPILAEGVESEAEFAFLRRERCHYVQGYLFGKPQSSEEIQPLVSGVPKVRAS